MPTTCEICGQQEPCEPCELCNRLACENCRDEADCCFVDKEELAKDPSWAPNGWKRFEEEFRLIFRRIEADDVSS